MANQLGQKILNFSIILLFLAVTVKGNDAFAWGLDGTPPSNVNGKVKMPNDLSEAKNKVSSSQKVFGKARVRIPIHLVPYKKVVSTTRGGETKTDFLPDEIIDQTLRARLDRPNHFYISGFHIETTPVSWDKQKNIYKINLMFNRLYGTNSTIEEQLGSVELTGQLRGKDNLYVIVGQKSRHFVNKRSQPVVNVRVGFSKSELNRSRNIPGASKPISKNLAPKKTKAPAVKKNIKAVQPTPAVKLKNGWSKG